VDKRYDEAEMRRFLLGDSTPEEQDRVGERIIADQDYHDAVGAMSDEILCDAVRGTLNTVDAVRLEAQLAESPTRRRALDDMRVFTKALDTEARSAALPLSRLWVPAGVVAAGIAAALLLWVNTRPHPTAPSPPPIATPGPAPHATNAIFTFVLAPYTRRTESVPQANLFRIPPQTPTVVLQLDAPTADISEPEATIRHVGTDAILVTMRPEIHKRGNTAQISVAVPASILRPADYVLAITASAGAGSEEIASRFFSVVE